MLSPKAFFSVYFFCVVLFPAFGQEEFKDGFIVDSNQKYVYGYVSFTDTPHLTCIFKTQKDNASVTYSTGQIQGYGIINGTHFRKRPIELPGSQTPAEIFMETVVDGPITLYVALERMFVERGASYYELKIDKDNQDTYRRTLMSLMGDCGAMAKKAKNVSITIISVKSLVEAYNVCAGGDLSVRNPKSIQELGIFTGLENTAFSIEGTGTNGLYNKNFTDRTLTVGGVHYKITPKWSKYFSLATGVWFNDQRFYLSARQSANGSSSVQTMRVNYTALNLPILVEVGNLVTSRVQPYVKTGISLPFMLKRNVSITREDEKNDIIYINTSTGGKDFKEAPLFRILGGVTIPVSERIHAYAEVYYSTGKNKFEMQALQKGEITGHFRSKGFNIGLAIRTF